MSAPKKPSERDYEAAALDYEAGGDDLTAEVVAEKHRIPYATLKDHAARGKWSQRRLAFRENATKAAREVLRQKLAQRMVAETEQDFNILRRAEVEVVAAIQSGELEANSLDAAIRVLVEVIRAKAQIAGEPLAERTEYTGAGGGPIDFHIFTFGKDGDDDGDGDGDGDSDEDEPAET